MMSDGQIGGDFCSAFLNPTSHHTAMDVSTSGGGGGGGTVQAAEAWRDSTDNTSIIACISMQASSEPGRRCSARAGRFQRMTDLLTVDDDDPLQV